MDITLYVIIAWFIGFVVGLVTMYVIIEVSYYQEAKRRKRRSGSMLDFAEYVAQERRNKKINFNLFENAGGSFDEQRAD